MKRTLNKISIAIFALFFTFSVKAQSVVLTSTLNTNSTSGNFYGTLGLSFTNTGAGGNNSVLWSTSQILPIYSDSASDAQISLSLTAGSEGMNTLNLYAGLTSLTDAQFGTVSDTSETSCTSPGTFIPGKPSNDKMVSTQNNQQIYYDSTDKLLVKYDFCYVLPVVFNGTSGNASGTWSLTYTVSAVPEPTTNCLMLFGGAGLLAARKWLRRA